MTTENSQKSKKYVITKLFANSNLPFEPPVEKQLCCCDTLQKCAEFILDNNEWWHDCWYGKKNLTTELDNLIVKLRNQHRRCDSLESDFS